MQGTTKGSSPLLWVCVFEERACIYPDWVAKKAQAGTDCLSNARRAVFFVRGEYFSKKISDRSRMAALTVFALAG